MKKLILFLFAFLFAVVANALPLPGMDYLGGVKFQREILSAHRAGYSCGIFLRTFGDARATVEAMAKQGKCSEITIHVAPFDKSHAYPIASLKRDILSDTVWAEGLARRYPAVKIKWSPLCEHNHRAAEMIPLFNEIKAKGPSLILVNTIWKGEVIPGIITEIHLSNSHLPRKPTGPYQVSMDGFGGDGSGDSASADVQSMMVYFSDALTFRVWAFRFNGKFGNKDTADIAHRKSWPSVEYITGHFSLFDPREGVISYPKNALYKTFADDHGQGGKDNKAMVITARNAASVDVFDSKGKKIDTMNRMMPNFSSKGSPLDKLPRYYSGKYAYQIAALAKRNTGSQLIRIDRLPLTDGDLRSSYK